MFDEEIKQLRQEILNLKQQKLKSISAFQTVETRIPIQFILHGGGGGADPYDQCRIDIWPTNDVKPLVSWYLDESSLPAGVLVTTNFSAEFDSPPDFKFHARLGINYRGQMSEGYYNGQVIDTAIVVVSTSKINYTVTDYD